ncbi:ATP-binding cassette domain-containing protein [Streptomyces eurythermus]|uniref:ATP-binding cassette domain-containing protein n=1 Tax=Streptomyces eurythermus TaxID=42237 RepID=UPI0033CC80AC
MNDSPRGGHEPCGITAARLRAQNLVVRCGDKTVLDVADLDLATGVTALTGANGAGKSTLLKVFAQLVPLASGYVTLGAEKVNSDKTRAGYRAAIGYLPQDPDFPGNFTVEEAITYSAWLRGVPASRRTGAVQRVIGELSLTKWASTRLKNLSGGNRQRVHIAQTIVHKPLVLLLDEPTTGIDVEHRIGLRKILGKLGNTCCIVMSTHHTEDIELLADRVVSLREGTVVFQGTPQELIARAKAQSSSASQPSREARSIEQALRDLGGTE